MEKEKILRQLEEKLLPSVKNLEQGQATEHDFFPALLWMLLEKSKDSESLLNSAKSEQAKELQALAEKILQNAHENQQNSSRHIEQNISELRDTLTNQSNTTKSEQAKELQALAERILQNAHENKKFQGGRFDLIEEKQDIFLKIQKKFSIWLVVLAVFQLAALSVLAFILLR